MTRKTYPSDVTDEEWQLILPYLTLVPLDAPQREHDLREVFNALRWMIRTGAQWRYIPHEFPPCLDPKTHLTGGIAGKSFNNKHNVGLTTLVLRIWFMTYMKCFVLNKVKKRNPQQR